MSGTVRFDRLLANLLRLAQRGATPRASRRGDFGSGAGAGCQHARSPHRRSGGALACQRRALDPMPGMALMLHKPVGVTCSHKEAGPLVYDLLPRRWRRREPALSTVGRLDKESSGLLLLTDDGALLHRIISPKKHVAKHYVATLARPLKGDEAAHFAAGTLMLEGEAKPSPRRSWRRCRQRQPALSSARAAIIRCAGCLPPWVIMSTPCTATVLAGSRCRRILRPVSTGSLAPPIWRRFSPKVRPARSGRAPTPPAMRRWRLAPRWRRRCPPCGKRMPCG